MSQERDTTEVNHANTNPDKRRNRKKRKNFLSNAKKYAKKGQLGRGTQLPEELFQYFVGILDAMKGGIESEEERSALVNNVLERTKEQELNVVGNQLGCRVVEVLLPYSSAEDIERFIDILSPELRRLCSDNFSSHVIETLLRVTCDRATEHLQIEDNSDDVDADSIKKKPKLEIKSEDKKPKFSKKHIQTCYDFTIKLCKYALNNLEDFVWDSYANHILRSALKCLSGITYLPGEKPKVNMFVLKERKTKSIPPHVTKLEYKVVPEEFKEIVKEFANRLSAWPQLQDMPYDPITSGLLQVLLYAIKNVDKDMTKDLIKILLNESFAPDNWVSTGNDDKKEKIDVDMENSESQVQDCSLPPVFESEPAVRLLEAALFVAKKKMYTLIYAKCFINRLGQLALMPMLNFTVQRLIDNCNVKEEFEPIFEELSPRLGAVLVGGNTGVLVALAKACLRLQVKQTQFINSLESALECSEASPKWFPVCCLRVTPRARLPPAPLERDYFIHIHGSVLLQCILEFQRPTKAVAGLLDLSPEELVVILKDVKGSHVADALCRSPCVGAKPRDKLVLKLKGHFQELALSAGGSRALERLFGAAGSGPRCALMEELAHKAGLLQGSVSGRLVAANLDVETFKLARNKWEKKWLHK